MIIQLRQTAICKLQILLAIFTSLFPPFGIQDDSCMLEEWVLCKLQPWLYGVFNSGQQRVLGFADIQYRSNVSYHLSSRFSRDSSRFLRDDSRFSQYKSRFSRESQRRSVRNILLVRSRFPCTVKGRYQSDETDRQDDKKDTERQLLAGLKYLR